MVRFLTPCAPLLIGLATALIAQGGCSKRETPQKRTAAPPKGPVGKVLGVRGEVTYLAGGGPARKLAVGDTIRAEWVVRTGSGGWLKVKLNNGHTWTMEEELDKRVGDIRALSLPPVEHNTLDKLAQAGTPRGKDRSSASGVYQGRTAASRSAPTRLLDERQPRRAPRRDPKKKPKGGEDTEDRDPVTREPTVGNSRRPGSGTKELKEGGMARPIVRPPSGGRPGPRPIAPRPRPRGKPRIPLIAGRGRTRTGFRTRVSPKQVLARQRAAMARCARQVQAIGRHMVWVRVRTDGRVATVRVTGKRGGQMRRCVFRRLRNVRFPTRPKAYTVTLPLVF